MLTGFSDGELTFHNDRTAHPVRADFITLLGMRCPEGDAHLHRLHRRARPAAAARRRRSRPSCAGRTSSRRSTCSRATTTASLTVSEQFTRSSRTTTASVISTRHTTVAPGGPPQAKDALIALKNAIVAHAQDAAPHPPGDLFTFANQDGLHSREKIEVSDPAAARSRWLLKTYAFRDQAAASRHADRWLDGVHGRVGD